MSLRIKTDDEVLVIGGKDRGKRGKVLRVDPKRHKVYVEGLNMVKRHQRPRSVKDNFRGAANSERLEGAIQPTRFT